mgnify:CR=1 FL=1
MRKGLFAAVAALADAIEELRPHGRARDCVARARGALADWEASVVGAELKAAERGPPLIVKPPAKKKAAKKAAAPGKPMAPAVTLVITPLIKPMS